MQKHLLDLTYTKAPNHNWIKEIQSHNVKVQGDASQTGEGRTLQFIFDTIGTVNKTCVEFGAVNGYIHSNTLILEKEDGWNRILFDIAPSHARVIKANITVEGINAEFHMAKVPHDVDLVSIDINGNDYWVWDALCDFKPAVILIEYNQCLGYTESKTIKYNPFHIFDNTTYFGASLPAMVKLGKKKWYKLVYANRLNAFFIKEELIPNSPELLVNKLEAKRSGWPVDKSNRIWITIK